MRDKLRSDESGLVIVEATIVFPVMFLVIFLMLFTGNAYLQKCRVDSYVNQLAIDGAAYCADPMLEEVVDGSIPSVANSNVYPYRYFDPNGALDIKDTLEIEISKKINNMSTGLFSGMKPANQIITVEYNNGFIYSTFSVTVDYKIVMPIRLLGSNENISMSLSSHANMPVSDTAEFIRNVDMAEDYMEKYGIKEKLEEAKKKLDDAIQKAKDWFNK